MSHHHQSRHLISSLSSLAEVVESMSADLEASEAKLVATKSVVDQYAQKLLSREEQIDDLKARFRRKDEALQHALKNLEVHAKQVRDQEEIIRSQAKDIDLMGQMQQASTGTHPDQKKTEAAEKS